MSEQISAPSFPVTINGKTETLFKNCKSCHFAIKKPSPTLRIGQWLAECRKNPPVVITLPARGGLEINVITQWPSIGDGPGFFCDCFKPKIMIETGE